MNCLLKTHKSTIYLMESPFDITTSYEEEILIDNGLSPNPLSSSNAPSSGKSLNSEKNLSSEKTPEPDIDAMLNTIPLLEERKIICAKGHERVVLVRMKNEGCLICQILKKINRTNFPITCLSNSYTYGQTKFTFQCKFKHLFVAGINNCGKGCRSCFILHISRNKGADINLDIQCLNSGVHSRLRFHCNKFRHNPECLNPECIDIRENKIISDRDYAENCRNFIQCDQDFYATQYQITHKPQVLSCERNHHLYEKREITACLRIFEHLFDKRFDNPSRFAQVEFSGYNQELNIAFTHLGDKIPAMCLEYAEKWCMDNKSAFVIIPEDLIKEKYLLPFIIESLQEYGLFEDEKKKSLYNEIRAEMKYREKHHKFFDNRCIY